MKMIQMDSLRMNNLSIYKVGSHSGNNQNLCFLWTLPFDSLNVCSVFTVPQRPSDEHRTHLCQVNVWDDVLASMNIQMIKTIDGIGSAFVKVCFGKNQ